MLLFQVFSVVKEKVFEGFLFRQENAMTPELGVIKESQNRLKTKKNKLVTS